MIPTPSIDLELLRALVDEPAGSYDVAHLERGNALLAEHMEACGLRVVSFALPERAAVLVGERTLGSGEGPVVTLVGHLDTVWPAGSVDGWRMDVDADADRISGPAVGDMKAALLMAVEAIARAASDTAGDGVLRLVVIPDEEVGSVDSRPLLEQLADTTDLCLGLEAGKADGAVVASRGAVGAMRVESLGNAVHVTEPGGIHAVDPLVDLLSDVTSLSSPDVQVSVCHVRAGDSRQVSAPTAMFEVDLRADEARHLDDVVAAIRRTAARADSSFAGTVTSRGGATRPAFPPSASAPVLDAIGRAGHDLPRTMHERGGSDASFFAARGVPTLDGLGPWCEGNCTRDERIVLSSIETRIALMADLMRLWIDERIERSA